MDNLSIYNELKKRVGCENKDTIWDNARLIYEQCYDKKYRNIFSNQQEFAEYLGITKGRVSQYKYAYEYFLLYQNRIDLRILSVEQVYTLYRTVGSMLFDFFNWVEKEKKKSLINIGLKETKRLIEEYHNCIFNKNSTIMNKVYNYMLSESFCARGCFAAASSSARTAVHVLTKWVTCHAPTDGQCTDPRRSAVAAKEFPFTYFTAAKDASRAFRCVSRTRERRPIDADAAARAAAALELRTGSRGLL